MGYDRQAHSKFPTRFGGNASFTGYISAGYYTENVVNGRFDRSNISDRLLAGCSNSLCSVAVDLGFMYNNISQFKAYTGYSGVSCRSVTQ